MIKKQLYNYLKSIDKSIQPYFIKEIFIDGIYLPKENLIIIIDTIVDKEYKANCENIDNYCELNNIKVIRVRNCNCLKLNTNSIQLFYTNLSNIDISKILNKILDKMCLENYNCFFTINSYEEDVISFNELYKNTCKEFIEKTKIPFIEQECIYNNLHIGIWAMSQDVLNIECKISNQLIVINKTINSSWDKNYTICEFLKMCGQDINMLKYNYVYQDYKIGIWLNIQRNEFQNNIMSLERKILLENIGMKWNLFHSQWDKTFELAKEWCELNNTKHIPKTTIYKDTRIGYWLQTQRKEYTNGEIYPNRLKLLEDYGFNLGNLIEDKWQTNFDILKAYIEKTNDRNISKRFVWNNNEIGKWLYSQKISFRKGSMSKDHYDKLVQLGLDIK